MTLMTPMPYGLWDDEYVGYGEKRRGCDAPSLGARCASSCTAGFNGQLWKSRNWPYDRRTGQLVITTKPNASSAGIVRLNR
jgi:hypothetical protein